MPAPTNPAPSKTVQRLLDRHANDMRSRASAYRSDAADDGPTTDAA